MLYDDLEILMLSDEWNRFINDVEYELLAPPFGLGYNSMTDVQAKENFEWFVSKIPERVEYLRNRCAQDLKVSVDRLNFTPESLILIWQWFLKATKVERSKEYYVNESGQKVEKHWSSVRKVLGLTKDNELYIATRLIIYDIAMYLGEVFKAAYPNDIKWGYYTKPRIDIDARKPLLYGFYEEIKHRNCSRPIPLLEEVEKKVYLPHGEVNRETDLYAIFEKKKKDIFL